MADAVSNCDRPRRRGRPRSFDQDKLNFFVFFARLQNEMTAAIGREPTDTEMFQLVSTSGGYEHLVAGDWTEIEKVQKATKVDAKVAALRWGTHSVRSKTITDMKTLRNFYAITKQQAATDPAFSSFAQSILEQYGVGKSPPREITSGHCSGWMPPLKHSIAN
jgi:hypothetical protein